MVDVGLTGRVDGHASTRVWWRCSNTNRGLFKAPRRTSALGQSPFRPTTQAGTGPLNSVRESRARSGPTNKSGGVWGGCSTENTLRNTVLPCTSPRSAAVSRGLLGKLALFWLSQPVTLNHDSLINNPFGGCRISTGIQHDFERI